MDCYGVRTRQILPGDDLVGIFLESLLESLSENSVIVVTSKIISVSENSIAICNSEREFFELIQQEADQVLGKSQTFDFWLTEKNGLVMPNAGIDKSNAEHGKVILLPSDSQKSADRFRESLRGKTGLHNLGVIVADSRVIPFRAGISGVALAWSGFVGVSDERGKPDIYGKPLRVSQLAIADNIASIAQIFFGQSNEKTPFAVFKNAPVTFTNQQQDPYIARISPAEDLYTDFFRW